MELIAVILKSPTSTQRFESAKVLLNYGFAAYSLTTVQPPQALRPIPVALGDIPAVQPVLGGSSTLLAPKEKIAGLEVHLEQAEGLAAPVEAGQQVGRMTVTSGGEVLADIPLVAEQAVARLTYWQILRRCLQMAFLGG